MGTDRIRVSIDGERDYDILVGPGLLSSVGREIRRRGLGARALVITSPRIGRLFLPALLGGLRRAGVRACRVSRIPDGERHKTFATFHRLLREIARFDREKPDLKLIIVNLGGGVVLDTAGFAAACHKRGAAFVQVPTTLLGLVDCGIGGKTGVNFEGVKNAVGAFWQPRLVVADPRVLRTLPLREFRSGLAEVVKHAVIASPSFFGFIERNTGRITALDPSVVRRVVLDNYRLKAAIVGRDERDTKGVRAILNYGHTVGHAVESASRYALRHGEAVSIGMACANDLAVSLGILDRGTAGRIENLLVQIGLPVRIPRLGADRIMRFLARDKKFVNGRTRFVLAHGIGRMRIREGVSPSLIRRVLLRRSP